MCKSADGSWQLSDSRDTIVEPPQCLSQNCPHARILLSQTHALPIYLKGSCQKEATTGSRLPSRAGHGHRERERTHPLSLPHTHTHEMGVHTHSTSLMKMNVSTYQLLSLDAFNILSQCPHRLLHILSTIGILHRLQPTNPTQMRIYWCADAKKLKTQKQQQQQKKKKEEDDDISRQNCSSGVGNLLPMSSSGDPFAPHVFSEIRNVVVYVRKICESDECLKCCCCCCCSAAENFWSYPQSWYVVRLRMDHVDVAS